MAEINQDVYPRSKKQPFRRRNLQNGQFSNAKGDPSQWVALSSI